MTKGVKHGLDKRVLSVFFGHGTVAVSQSRPLAGSNGIDLWTGTSGLRADVGNLVIVRNEE